MYMYIFYSFRLPHTLMSSYRSVWRTERNVRTVNAQGALSLIRCKPGGLKEMCGPYERCSQFVTAFSVRTDRKSKMRTESVGVYWTCVIYQRENDVNLQLKQPGFGSNMSLFRELDLVNQQDVLSFRREPCYVCLHVFYRRKCAQIMPMSMIKPKFN